MAGLKNPSGRTVETPLEVLPISVRSPSMQKSNFLLRRRRMKEGITLELRGTRTHYLLTQSSPLGSYHPSYGTLTSRGRMPCPSRRLQPYRFKKRTACSYTFICLFCRCFKLFINFISFLQVATYAKSLAKRACFSEGSVRVVEEYKAEVASLTSERADLRAQVRRLTKESVKHKSDLKHTPTAKS